MLPSLEMVQKFSIRLYYYGRDVAVAHVLGKVQIFILRFLFLSSSFFFFFLLLLFDFSDEYCLDTSILWQWLGPQESNW